MGRITHWTIPPLLALTGCGAPADHGCERPILVVANADADTADTERPEGEPPLDPWDGYESPPVPWQGAYEGPISLFRDLDGELVEFCQGSVTAFVDERATLEAFGGCDGPAPGSRIEVGVAGQVGEFGRLQGTTAELWLEFDPFQGPVFPADGGFPDREQHLELRWTGSYALPDGVEIAFVAGALLFER